MRPGATCMSERLPKHLDDAAHAARLALRFAAGCSLDGYRADELRRSAVEGRVEIVGEGSRGCVALYRCDALDVAVEVLALRGQRESGFRDR